MNAADLTKSVTAMPVLISAVGGALVMWWALSDRMEKQITEKVNLVSRVSQLGERIEGLRAEIQSARADTQNLRLEMQSLRGQPKAVTSP